MEEILDLAASSYNAVGSAEYLIVDDEYTDAENDSKDNTDANLSHALIHTQVVMSDSSSICKE